MPPPLHSSVLKSIAVLISCHGNGLSFMTVQMSAFVWRNDISCLPPDNSLEALFIELLHYINRSGHPVIYLSGSASVFNSYNVGCNVFEANGSAKFYNWVQKMAAITTKAVEREVGAGAGCVVL